MSLFQNTVISRYLKTLDKQVVNTAYARFSSHFHDPAIQENIRNSKEEQYQAMFLNDLFVNILGYTMHPTSGYNLTTEYKNVKDSKKADGAIVIHGNVKAVIELKGTNTTDLSKIEDQAFGYKNNQPECVYVITSNFEKLRFYIDNAIEHIEFNLFTLTEKEFEILWLCLAYANIENGIPKKIKDESISQEDVITKALYNDYSLFKRTLHQNLVLLNPQFDALTLFKKSQKLLDRLLFLLFAEDRLLLPPNSVKLILNDWRDLQEREVQIPLYDRFKKYFEYLNTGYKGKRYDVFAYNGGLFKPDDILDTVVIDSELLFIHILKLSEYDFASEVDVNILGQIFENSLNELDELTAQLEGKQTEKAKTKRKKDGVFYTPKYITKYIVDNTLGKLCSEKKTELEINDEDYVADKKRLKNSTRVLADKLSGYRNWLLQLKICDPACGSGAFLNQALDFLIAEHHYIDELQAKLFGDTMILSDIEKSILENNLFGVDINEESVEIAKLSLWLRTAQPNRTLNDLNNNIKCGNSLIDAPEVAGEKAFNWYLEFPQVFPHYRKPKPQAGTIEPEPGDREYLDEVHEPLFSYKSGSKGFERHGFDVVVSNPPYVRQELLGEFKDYFSKSYKVYNFSSDLFSMFYEKAITILKHNGYLGFISNTFDKTNAGGTLRNFLKNNIKIEKYVDFTEVQIFEGATTYPIIMIAQNVHPNNNSFDYIKIPKGSETSELEIESYNSTVINQQKLESSHWSFTSLNSNALLSKISQYKNIREQYGKCYYGIKTGFNEAFIISKKDKEFIAKESLSDLEIIKPFYEGKDISKWHTPENEKYIIFTRRGIDIENYPGIKNWLGNYRSKLEPKNNPEQTEGRKSGTYKWFEIQDSVDYYKLFESSKIIWPNLQNSNKFCYDDKGYYINAPGVIFPSDNKALLPILNSRLVWYYLNSICVVRNGGYIEVKPQYFEQIPIPPISQSNQSPFIQKADLMLSLNKELQELSQKFQRTILRKFEIVEMPVKLQNWYLLSYKEFIAGLAKKKVKLSLSQEAEWEEYFNQESKKAIDLKRTIEITDNEIDRMVYALYGLTEEEIKIVEAS